MRDERVTTAERSEVIALLGRALDDGHLAVDEHDSRVVAVGTATYTSDLLRTLADLPPRYAWLPPAAVAPARPTGSGRAALIVGLLSVPASFCIVGGILGVVAIVLSLRGGRRPGLTPALVGRVFGIVGVVLSLGAAFALVYALNNSVGP